MNSLFIRASKRFLFFGLFFCSCTNNQNQNTQELSDAPIENPMSTKPNEQISESPELPEVDEYTEWKGALRTPVWAWKDEQGHVFLQFDWALEYLGTEQNLLIAAAKQKWNVKSEQEYFRPSLHPDTLHSQRSSGKTQKAMFYTFKPADLPSSVLIQYSIAKKNVLNIQQDVTPIPTTGLSIEIGEKGEYFFYQGRKHEASADLLHVRFTAKNNKDAPIVFSPFKWATKQGKTTWKYHHKTSIPSLQVIQPGGQISGTIALQAKKGTKKNSSATIEYQGEEIGVVTID